jgi:hypothetical protein
MRFRRLAILCAGAAAIAGCRIGSNHYFAPDAADAADAVDAAMPFDLDRPPMTPMIDFKAYIKASNTGQDDNFGQSVALSADGTTLAVGAMHEASASSNPLDDSAPGAGAVYVFTLDGAVWVQQAYIKARHPDIDDLFGASVALSRDGSTLAVGAMSEDGNARTINGDETDNSAPAAGAAYVFTRSGSTWSQQAYIKPNNMDEYDGFGTSVALSEDGVTLAVGAPGESSNGSGKDDNSLASSGAAYVFMYTGTEWLQQRYIKPSSPVGMIQFGAAVALSHDGNHLAVGVSREASYGEVYAFARNGTAWPEQLRYQSTDASTGFGGSVALSTDGSILAVGAVRDSINARGGAVFTFTRTGTTWSGRSVALAPDNADAGDEFGHGLALADDGTLAVGAALEDGNGTRLDGDPKDNSTDEAGAVYLFTATGAAWTQRTYIKASNTDLRDHFGDSVALSADGTTLAVGAVSEDSSATGVSTGSGGTDVSAMNAGAVYVYR